MLAALLQRQRVAEAFGREEGGAGGAARHHRVGRARRAVDQYRGTPKQRARREAELAGDDLERRRHAVENPLVHGQCLADVHLPIAVEHDDIREGSARVDGNPVGHDGLALLREVHAAARAPEGRGRQALHRPRPLWPQVCNEGCRPGTARSVPGFGGKGMPGHNAERGRTSRAASSLGGLDGAARALKTFAVSGQPADLSRCGAALPVPAPRHAPADRA